VKSLKEQNNKKLWLVIAVNALFFYAVLEFNAVRFEGLSALLSQAERVLPIGLAGIVATVLNALPSAELKAMLVFCRLKHALPGHRAFSVYAAKDARISPARLLESLTQKPMPSPSAGCPVEWRRA